MVTDDIVIQLRDWEYIITNSKNRAWVVVLSGGVFSQAADEIERLRAEKAELLEAIRLTAEYYLPPALDNWEWWKAYSKYADPEDAQRMKSYCDKAMAQEGRGE